MDYFRAFAISAAGMLAQRTRVEAATLNLANMYTSAPPGTQGYQPVTAIVRLAPASSTFATAASRVPMLATAQVVPQAGEAVRLAYEPGHPHANAAGMVAYPAVDPTQEMMTVMTALRAYESNLAALQATKTLAAKALEIGAQ